MREHYLYANVMILFLLYRFMFDRLAQPETNLSVRQGLQKFCSGRP